jgi:hypothetical protein
MHKAQIEAAGIPWRYSFQFGRGICADASAHEVQLDLGDPGCEVDPGLLLNRERLQLDRAGVSPGEEPTGPRRRGIHGPNHDASPRAAKIDTEFVVHVGVEFGWSRKRGTKEQLSAFCEPMMKPIPPEISQVSLPA